MAIKRTAMKHHPNIYEYETKRGKRYSVIRRYKDVAGKYQTYTQGGFPDWRSAEQNLRQFEAKLFDGSIASSETKKVTINTYFKMMSDRKRRLGIWKSSTAKISIGYYNHHFRNVFGNLNIQDLTRMQYQHFIDHLVESGNYTNNTLHRIDSLMQQIMNDAEINDVIYKNKLKHININGGNEAKNQTLTESEYDKLMETAQSTLSKYDYALIKLTSLGERRGELMGLHKKSFKFERNELTGELSCWITFNLARTADEPEGTTLKNESSYRTIFVADEYAELAKYALDYSEVIMKSFDQEITPDHFIWLNPQTGKPFHVQHANTLFKKLTRRTGITVHPHMMRHYFATKARSKRLSDTDVMHWLGHSSVTMTDSYTRETPEGAANVFKGIKGDI